MMGLDFENKASAEKVIQAAELHGNKDLSAQVRYWVQTTMYLN